MVVTHGLTRPDIGDLLRRRDIPGLLKALSMNDYIGFGECLEAFRKAPEESLGALREALSSPEARVREVAALFLAEMKRPEAIPDLIGALADDSWHVRFHAAIALGSMGREALEPLVIALEKGGAEARAGAAEVMGLAKDPMAAGPLSRAMGDPERHVRITAAWALGELRTEAAITPLVAALGDPDPEVRTRAALSLRWAMDRRAVPVLIQALEHGSAAIRRDAAAALGDLGSREALGPLIRAMTDPHWNVRQTAALALGQLRDVGALEALIHGLKDEHPGVRENVATALGELGDPRAKGPLKEVLNDLEFRNVQTAARRAIERIESSQAGRSGGGDGAPPAPEGSGPLPRGDGVK